MLDMKNMTPKIGRCLFNVSHDAFVFGSHVTQAFRCRACDEKMVMVCCGVVSSGVLKHIGAREVRHCHPTSLAGHFALTVQIVQL